MRSRTSRWSTRTPTKRTAAIHRDDDLSGAGAAARRRTGRFSSRADPSPCSMSRGKSSQEVDGRGVCSRQDHREKDPPDGRRRRCHRRRRRHRRHHPRTRPLGRFARSCRNCRASRVTRSPRSPSPSPAPSPSPCLDPCPAPDPSPSLAPSLAPSLLSR